MKEFIRELKTDKVTYYEFLISFIVLFTTTLLTLLNIRNIPPLVPLFNQLPWGNERLVGTEGVFIPLALYLGVFLFNFFFAVFLYKKNSPLLSRIIASVTLLLSIMVFLFITRIIFLIS